MGNFIRSGAVINRKFFLRKDLFSFMREQDVISYHLKSTMALNLFKKVLKKHTLSGGIFTDFFGWFWGLGYFLQTLMKMQSFLSQLVRLVGIFEQYINLSLYLPLSIQILSNHHHSFLYRKKERER